MKTGLLLDQITQENWECSQMGRKIIGQRKIRWPIKTKQIPSQCWLAILIVNNLHNTSYSSSQHFKFQKTGARRPKEKLSGTDTGRRWGLREERKALPAGPTHTDTEPTWSSGESMGMIYCVSVTMVPNEEHEGKTENCQDGRDLDYGPQPSFHSDAAGQRPSCSGSRH